MENNKIGFLGGSDSKQSACNVGDPGSIPGSGRSPGEGNGNPLQYSCLENPMEGGAWQATVHGVAKSRTGLSDLRTTRTTGNYRGSWLAQTGKNLPAVQETQVQSRGGEGPLEKGMAPHPSILAWRIPWTEGPGGLQCMVSQRVRMTE